MIVDTIDDEKRFRNLKFIKYIRVRTFDGEKSAIEVVGLGDSVKLTVNGKRIIF